MSQHRRDIGQPWIAGIMMLQHRRDMETDGLMSQHCTMSRQRLGHHGHVATLHDSRCCNIYYNVATSDGDVATALSSVTT